MSDIFSSVGAYESISAILSTVPGSATLYTSKETSRFKLEDFVPPKSKVRSKYHAIEVLRDEAVPIYTKRPLRSLQPVSFYQAFKGESFADITEIADVQHTVNILHGKANYYPFYKPTFFYSKGPDQVAVTELIYELAKIFKTGEEGSFQLILPDDIKGLVKDVAHAASTYYYGTGCAEGQIRRLIECWDVKRGKPSEGNPNRVEAMWPAVPPSKGPIWDFDVGMEELRVTLPLTRPVIYASGAVADSFPLKGHITDRIFRNLKGKVVDELPKINSKAKSGLPFPDSEKKASSLIDALKMVNDMYDKLGDLLRSEDSDAVTKEMKNFIEEYWYLTTGLALPKAERYEREEFLTKVRTIWSASFPLHLLGSVISQPVMDASSNNFPMDINSPSLGKFSAIKHMNELVLWIERCQKEKKSEYKIYADNTTYVWYDPESDDIQLASIDLEKGESNAQYQDAQLVGAHLLARGWVDKDGEPDFDLVWSFVALHLVPSLIIDGTYLWEDQLIGVPGQGSGNPWTYLVNHVMSTRMCYYLRESGYPKPNTPEFWKAIKDSGVNAKVALLNENVCAKLLDAKKHCKKDGWLGRDEEPVDAGKTMPKVVRLDLLGFDAVYAKALHKWVPVLSSDRLFPSFAYMKEEKGSKDENTSEKLAKSIIRYESLRFIGGWAYPGMDQALQKLAKEKRNWLKDQGYDLESIPINSSSTEFEGFFSDHLSVTTVLNRTSLTYVFEINKIGNVYSTVGTDNGPKTFNYKHVKALVFSRLDMFRTTYLKEKPKVKETSKTALFLLVDLKKQVLSTKTTVDSVPEEKMQTREVLKPEGEYLPRNTLKYVATNDESEASFGRNKNTIKRRMQKKAAKRAALVANVVSPVYKDLHTSLDRTPTSRPSLLNSDGEVDDSVSESEIFERTKTKQNSSSIPKNEQVNEPKTPTGQPINNPQSGTGPGKVMYESNSDTEPSSSKPSKKKKKSPLMGGDLELKHTHSTDEEDQEPNKRERRRRLKVKAKLDFQRAEKKRKADSSDEEEQVIETKKKKKEVKQPEPTPVEEPESEADSGEGFFTNLLRQLDRGAYTEIANLQRGTKRKDRDETSSDDEMAVPAQKVSSKKKALRK